eukprot:TRINITY_DN5720_c0_g1_i5.p4 TRINITY_DN5720_c0_g1~~TRINITY_DN5720_c0_g1_i5.p4  ORF type:complete len:112 (-),score=28.70 TRINITY_DN5720_c0_g1_i5:83-418(-)
MDVFVRRDGGRQLSYVMGCGLSQQVGDVGSEVSSGQTLGVKAQRFRGHTSPHRNVKEKKKWVVVQVSRLVMQEVKVINVLLRLRGNEEDFWVYNSVILCFQEKFCVGQMLC